MLKFLCTACFSVALFMLSHSPVLANNQILPNDGAEHYGHAQAKPLPKIFFVVRPAPYFLNPMSFSSSANFQIRIEQRIILRVPRQIGSRSNLSSFPNSTEDRKPPVWEKKDEEDCVAMRSIMGMRIFGNHHIMLFLREQQYLQAELEPSCSARDFYEGFYLHSNDDGRLCVKRDILQARSGRKCTVVAMNQMKPKK